MSLLDLGAGSRPVVEVAQNFGIGVELHLQLDVIVRQRDERMQAVVSVGLVMRSGPW